jgi:hypothetical protein
MLEHETTQTDFEDMSWHDDCIYGISFRTSDPEAGDWRSELELKIDHIVEWVKRADKRFQFRVAPAVLTFHDVTDPKIDADWGDSGFQVTLHEPTIHEIRREPISDQKICLDQAYYAWTIELNSPREGRISFGASGYSQRLLCEPVLCDQQSLAPGLRQRLLAEAGQPL